MSTCCVCGNKANGQFCSTECADLYNQPITDADGDVDRLFLIIMDEFTKCCKLFKVETNFMAMTYEDETYTDYQVYELCKIMFKHGYLFGLKQKKVNMDIKSGICLDLNAAINRIQELGKGKILYLRHQIYGEYLIKCNPQGNRFFATPVNGTKSHDQVVNNIDGFILWGYGDWSIITEEEAKDIEYPVCEMCKRRL